MPKQNKMMQLVNCRLRLTLQDGRVMVGQLLAFDKFMNLVIADCEEFRRTRASSSSKKTGAPTELQRTLGLVVLRGETIVTLCPEGGPPPAGGNKARVPASVIIGAGAGRTIGRGIAVPPPGAPPIGLAGPPPGMYAARPGVPMPYQSAIGMGGSIPHTQPSTTASLPPRPPMQ